MKYFSFTKKFCIFATVKNIKLNLNQIKQQWQKKKLKT